MSQQPGGWGKRAARLYTVVGVLLLNTLVLLVLLEAGARLVLAARPQPTLEQSIADFKQKMLAQAYYQSQEWSARYWDEHFHIVDNWTYSPYVLWQTRPYAGELIQVDSQGRRAVPNSACAADTYRIYTFGGSTMWGYGVFDGATIPAYIQAGFDAGRVCVVNQAEVGFNSTQGLIRLVRLIEQGDIPDMVIFYDGSNDVTVAHRTSTPGAHFYMENIAPVVHGDILNETGTSRVQPLRELLGQTALYRLVIGEPPAPQPAWALPPFAPEFSTGIEDVYLSNIRMAAALAEEYDFAFYAFLQPVLPVVAREFREGEEQQFIWETPGGLVALFQSVYPTWEAAASAADDDGFISLAHLLDDQTNPVWIDFNHLTGWGNLVVGGAIVEAIRPQVEADLN